MIDIKLMNPLMATKCYHGSTSSSPPPHPLLLLVVFCFSSCHLLWDFCCHVWCHCNCLLPELAKSGGLQAIVSVWKILVNCWTDTCQINQSVAIAITWSGIRAVLSGSSWPKCSVLRCHLARVLLGQLMSEWMAGFTWGEGTSDRWAVGGWLAVVETVTCCCCCWRLWLWLLPFWPFHFDVIAKAAHASH